MTVCLAAMPVSPVVAVLLVAMCAICVAAVIASIYATVFERNTYRAQLRDLDNLYDFVSLRDQELLVPFADRVAKPVVEVLMHLGQRIAPTNYIANIRSKFLRAGELDPAVAERFLARKLAGAIGGFVGFVVFIAVRPMGGGIADLGIAGLCLMLGFLGPDASVNRRVEERERAVLRELPDILDLLVICVEAGLGFDSALSRTVQSVEQGEMSREFSLALGQMQAGATRSEALTGVGDRVRVKEVQSFVSAIRQADRFGVAISSVLREQAKDIRIARSQRAREKAMQAPVKMLIPMVFFIFPPLFMLVLAPAALSFSQSGGFGG